LIFWAFDEPVADAFGINSKRLTNVFMVMLALAVVMAMQVAGVVLAAAMLVLPGAAALNLSAKLRSVFIFSLVISLVGAGIGLLIGIQGEYPIGPMVVLVQSVIYLLSLGIKVAASKLRS
jgi:ABC-type Mn2+/Zn2+ transport system permease subunit